MKCYILTSLFVGFLEGSCSPMMGPGPVLGGDAQPPPPPPPQPPATPGEELRQTAVQTLTSKDGVHCRQEVTDFKCPVDGVTFWLYTRDRQDNPYQLDPGSDDSICNAPFVQNQPVKVLIHGYTMNRDTAINQELRPAYFDTFNYNIISVDWSALCPDNCYKQAALSVPTVGSCMGKFLNNMRNLRTDIGEIHVLGHSLGAHVAAWASLELRLGRVTQFDPASPLFTDADKQLFKRPVAGYADVWHSNGGMKGRDGASGTVDLYLNDETNQPGCNCDSSCSHLRAVKVYAETITDRKGLQGFPCSGFEDYKNNKCPVPTVQALAEFGEVYTSTAQGSFLAFTDDKKPFIIRGEEYTDEQKFRGFKSVEQNCPVNDVLTFLGKALNLT